MEGPEGASFHNEFNRTEMEKCLSEDQCTLFIFPEHFLVLTKPVKNLATDDATMAVLCLVKRVQEEPGRLWKL